MTRPSLYTRFAGHWCDECRLAVQWVNAANECPVCGGQMRTAEVTINPTDIHGARSPDPERQDRMDALRLHLKSVHRNEAALNLINEEAVDQHDDEHNGPGGLRNHDGPEQLHDWRWPGGVRDVERGA